jgi:hypothetical protein
MRHLIPSLSSHAFTLSLPALVHFFVLIANHLYTFHVGMNVALNPGQERACILCSLSRTFFPNKQKAPWKTQNVDLTNIHVGMNVALNPGQERDCRHCRHFLAQSSHPRLLRPADALSPRRRHDLSVEASRHTTPLAPQMHSLASTKRFPPTDCVGFNAVHLCLRREGTHLVFGTVFNFRNSSQVTKNVYSDYHQCSIACIVVCILKLRRRANRVHPVGFLPEKYFPHFVWSALYLGKKYQILHIYK